MVRLFGCTVALLWIAAWWSWGLQVRCLIGQRGLLPLAEFFARAHAAGTPTPLQAPSIFWLWPTDLTILLALCAGIVCATLAVFDVAPKRALGVSALLYISFMAPGRPFFPMLVDRLLLEATALVWLLPRDRPGAAMQWLARGLIFKLYCEIGLSQLWAPDHAWRQGVALRTFLETTPLPTPLGLWAVHLPDGWLNLATRVTVFVLVFAPWLVFGTRAMRLVAAVLLTLVQLAVTLLSNYGLFPWLATALHLFLLADRDVARVQADIGRMSPKLAAFFGRLTESLQAARPPWGRWAPKVLRIKTRLPVAAPRVHRGARATAAMALMFVYVMGSLLAMWPAAQNRAPAPLQTLGHALEPWHVINSYTALGAPLGRRTEPLIEAMVDNVWRPLYLWHQPQDPWARPKFVAPHQPRLDVLLSAWGRQESFEPLPRFVGRLMETLCDEPQVLARLFASPLPGHPQAVRLSLWRLTASSSATLRDFGRYWDKEKIADGPRLVCPRPN